MGAWQNFQNRNAAQIDTMKSIAFVVPMCALKLDEYTIQVHFTTLCKKLRLRAIPAAKNSDLIGKLPLFLMNFKFKNLNFLRRKESTWYLAPGGQSVCLGRLNRHGNERINYNSIESLRIYRIS
uniref:Uncharacterized protein n=1 Tax=Romanomermis culicivorax TaxID=13658 RepID=A0A915KPV1_ROMCU